MVLKEGLFASMSLKAMLAPRTVWLVQRVPKFYSLTHSPICSTKVSFNFQPMETWTNELRLSVRSSAPTGKQEVVVLSSLGSCFLLQVDISTYISS